MRLRGEPAGLVREPAHRPDEPGAATDATGSEHEADPALARGRGRRDEPEVAALRAGASGRVVVHGRLRSLAAQQDRGRARGPGRETRPGLDARGEVQLA